MVFWRIISYVLTSIIAILGLFLNERKRLLKILAIVILTIFYLVIVIILEISQNEIPRKLARNGKITVFSQYYKYNDFPGHSIFAEDIKRFDKNNEPNIYYLTIRNKTVDITLC